MVCNKKTASMERPNDSTRNLIAFVVAVGLACGAGTVHADFTFGEPVLFDEPVNSTGREYFDCISADGLELYVERTFEVVFVAEDWDLYVSTRETTGDPWSVVVSLGPTLNSDYMDGWACLSGDGLELYFASRRPSGHGSYDIWIATRPTRSDPWETPVNLGSTINTVDAEREPWIMPDGLELYFSSRRPGGYGLDDIWVATRSSTGDTWGEPINLGPVVNSAANDSTPCLSSDGLVLFFSEFEWLNEWRPGGQGLSDMWMTRRKSTADPWEPPVNLGKGMNTNCWDSQPRISPDGSVLYFTSSRPDSAVLTMKRDIWQAPIVPITDFNGDGKVDGAEVSTMAGRWGTDDSVCDIAPMAWGDGIVGVEDLKVLAEYIGKDVIDNTLIAHWALDEAEGDVAHDSTHENDAVVVGGAAWQPEGGVIGGALEFDGVDAYIETPPVVNPAAGGPFLNPAEGPFSVLAWIKGEIPGQVILSQSGGNDWLLTDANGALMTDLKGSGRMAASLYSQAVITDGQWHRIGLTWDGLNRRLCVDGVTVAEDVPNRQLPDTWEGFHIGCGTNLEPGTFFSGLIDDVRIYHRAVRP